MKVFVAGATGVLGRAACAHLVAAGHAVTGVARSPEKAKQVESARATPVNVDLFDPEAALAAVEGHDAVCSFATRIPPLSSGWRASAWRENDRLFREAPRVLVDASIHAGVQCFVQISSGFMYADAGDRWIDEDCPIDPPPHGLGMFEAEEHTRRFAAAGGRGVALRFGLFYGWTGSYLRDTLRQARFSIAPTLGRPNAFFPAIHTDDLGPATVAALNASTGVYNVVDNEPLTRREYAAALSSALDIGSLRQLPAAGWSRWKRVNYLTRSQRVSNQRFKAATDWVPIAPSARDGWRRTVPETRKVAS